MIKLASQKGPQVLNKTSIFGNRQSFLQKAESQARFNRQVYSQYYRQFASKRKKAQEASQTEQSEQEKAQVEPEVQIELDEEFVTDRKSNQEDFKRAYEQGNGTERAYNFSDKRLTITNLKSIKSDQISTIQIDGKDKSVAMLATERSRASLRELRLKAKQVIQETYLPKDFPESVSKEFLPFTIYSMIGSTSNAAMLFLSTQSLFYALGGSQTQSQLAAAAYTWVLKDGIGQLGGILFASRYGGQFDEDIKKWRFFAMSSLNLAIAIEIMTLKFPHLFLLLASTANMMKNICFLMAAASRAQINMRFAKQNNIADIAGKSVSQFTTSSLLGMGLGIGLSKLVDISQLSQLVPLFGVLTFINLYATYASANLIDEVYLNNQRSKLLFDEMLSSKNQTGKVPTMKEINDRSNFTVPNFMNWHYCRFIRFGENSISHVIGKSKPNYYITSLLHQLHKADRGFVYYIDLLPWWKRHFARIINNGRPYVIQINMQQNAKNIDQLSAYYFARLLDLELSKLFNNTNSGQPQDGAGDAQGEHQQKQIHFKKIQNCIRIAELHFSQVNIEEFAKELEEQEWSLDYIYLDRKQNLYHYKLEQVQTVETSQQTNSEDDEGS